MLGKIWLNICAIWCTFLAGINSEIEISISFQIKRNMIVAIVFYSIFNQMQLHLVQIIEWKTVTMHARSYSIKFERKWKSELVRVRVSAENHATVVPRGFRDGLNWALVILRDSSLSASCTFTREILLNETEIRLYWPFSDMIWTQTRTSVWIQINQKMVNTI